MAKPFEEPMTIAVMEWALDRLKIESPDLFEQAEIRVIPVEYHGVYPALGIRYPNGTDTDIDLRQTVSFAIDDIVGEKSFMDFLFFLEKSNESWSDRWKQLLASRTSEQ